MTETKLNEYLKTMLLCLQRENKNDNSRELVIHFSVSKQMLESSERFTFKLAQFAGKQWKIFVLAYEYYFTCPSVHKSN